MANYTEQEAAIIVGNRFIQKGGEGWIVSECWCDNEVEFTGWCYSLIDANGNPLEFILTKLPEDATEAVRDEAVKVKIQTLENVG